MKPVLLHYYVTTRCNAACSFCTIWQEEHTVDAELPDVIANLKQAKSAGCRFVDFTGGEPLLNHNLPDFLLEAKKLGYYTSVTTNCILFPKRAIELAGLIDLLHFSIDADTAALHDAIRGRRSFDAVMESIDCALENNLVPDLLFTYTNQNIDAFEGIYAIARKKKLIVILDPVFDTTGNDPTSIATHQKARAFANRPGIYLNHAHLTLRKQGGNQRAHPLCRSVESTIVILPDNTLALPCFHHKAQALAIKGNLIGALADIARKNELALQGRNEFCEGCHINCYFDPSFNYALTLLSLQSIGSKMKYAWDKYARFRRPLPGREH